MRPTTRVLLTALGLVAFAAGCDRSVERAYYGGSHSPASSSGDPGYLPARPSTDDCIDLSGFGGHGCWKCPATASDELLNACTDSRFEEFDNTARIGGYVESDPRP